MTNLFKRAKKFTVDVFKSGDIIKIFAFIFTALIILTIIQALFLKFVLGKTILYQSGIFYPTVPFGDFFLINDSLVDFDPYHSPVDVNYPPFAILINIPFLWIMGKNTFSVRSFTAILLYHAIAVFLLIIIIRKIKRKYNLNYNTGFIFFLLCFSFPFLFLTERFNNLLFVFIFTLIFVLYYDDESKYKREAALLCLAMASAMKIYPCLFALILLKEKKIYALLRAAGYTVVLLIVPFFAFKGGLNNLKPMIDGLFFFSGEHLASGDPLKWYRRMCYNCSFTNFFQILYNLLPGHSGRLSGSAVKIFTYLSYGLLALMLLSCLFLKKKWQLFLMIALAVILCPSVSYSYVLILIFISFIMFLFEAERNKKDLFYLVLFILIFSPLQFFSIYLQTDLPFEYGYVFGLPVTYFFRQISMFIFAGVLFAAAFKNVFAHAFADKEK